MKPGPPPKPLNLRLLEGNPGKVPLNLRQPRPEAGSLECPAYLDRYGREEWRRIVGQALTMGYAVTDVSTLAMACDAYAQWRRARAKCADRTVRRRVRAEGQPDRVETVRLDGLVQESGANGLVPSAWFRIATEAQRIYLRFVGELGLSPAARTRIETEPILTPPQSHPTKTGTDDPGRFFRDQ
jgi:P27 family predicted phage terminase small subunit